MGGLTAVDAGFLSLPPPPCCVLRPEFAVPFAYNSLPSFKALSDVSEPWPPHLTISLSSLIFSPSTFNCLS